MTEIIFAVLFVSLMGLTRCYKTTVFLHLSVFSDQSTDSEAKRPFMSTDDNKESGKINKSRPINHKYFGNVMDQT